MSVAKALNLAIALAEEKPHIVRSISRSLTLEEMPGLSHATSRLEQALRNREMKASLEALEDVQKFSMVLTPASEWPPERTQAWFEGIAAIEMWIDSRIDDLRRDLHLREEV